VPARTECVGRLEINAKHEINAKQAFLKIVVTSVAAVNRPNSGHGRAVPKEMQTHVGEYLRR